MKVHVVDPPAYTPPYDHALCAALARHGLDVDLFTSAFAYAELPPPDGYARHELFYRHARGTGGSRVRRAAKAAEHVPDMLRYRAAAHEADIVHFQWLTLPGLDGQLLPRGRPLVLTAHDALLREGARRRATLKRLYSRFDAVIAHSRAGAERLVTELGLSPERVHTIPHGAFTHLANQQDAPLPPELDDGARRGAVVVLYFGLLRPHKGLDVLLRAWQGVEHAELWIVGRPRFEVAQLRAAAPPNVRWVPRFVSDAELAACFARAELVVLPYREIEQSGVAATALAFGSALVLSDIGGFSELGEAGAARLVPPGDAQALRAAIVELLADPKAREQLSAAARALAAGAASWESVAAKTAALYATLLS
ncbi:MAG: glycosyltransferase family 4 protein [Solirubrobacteraceae bacterium]